MKKTMLLCLTWISSLCWVLTGCSTDKDTLLPMASKP
jgi:predicted small secreted protein